MHLIFSLPSPAPLRDMISTRIRESVGCGMVFNSQSRAIPGRAVHQHLFSTLIGVWKQLAAKKLSPELHEVLSNVTEIIKEIRHEAFNSRIFEALCEEMGSESTQPRRNAEVSRGKILTRRFVLREEVKLFFQEQNHSVVTLGQRHCNRFFSNVYSIPVCLVCL
ncbi:uncharacterized protein TNCV_4322091 [Trichonephila clavipes]|uniref:Uncharacterized protein n=1 Tax=Trichonephila clavipes TaxID=2585209 RepID=A0A8X6VKM6_TRICX|nr:uncharacterized protein TNCV_4322091 [Trichonephila clavipes]